MPTQSIGARRVRCSTGAVWIDWKCGSPSMAASHATKRGAGGAERPDIDRHGKAGSVRGVWPVNDYF